MKWHVATATEYLGFPRGCSIDSVWTNVGVYDDDGDGYAVKSNTVVDYAEWRPDKMRNYGYRS